MSYIHLFCRRLLLVNFEFGVNSKRIVIWSNIFELYIEYLLRNYLLRINYSIFHYSWPQTGLHRNYCAPTIITNVVL